MMELLESKRKLAETESYLSLNTKLEEIVEDELMSLLSDVRDYLEGNFRVYKKIVSLEEERVKMNAQAEGRYTVAVQKLVETSELSYEESKKIIDEKNKKSIGTDLVECLFGVIKSTAYAIILSLISRKASSDYSHVTQNYISAIKSMCEAVTLRATTKRLEQENLCKRIELDQECGRTSLKLQSNGIDEKTADSIVLNPDLYIYGVLNSLKDKYGVDL